MKKVGIFFGICIAAVVGLFLFGLIAGRPISEERLKELGIIEPDSRFIEVDGVRTRYVEMGDGAETILFIHGFSSSLFSWRSCLEPISKEFRVVALDLKGFGFSGKPDTSYTTDEYVDFVVHFMDALGLQTATLCGNSMGGGIAWRTALEYPDRVDKLILVDAAGYPSTRSGTPFIMKLGRLPGSDKLFSLLTTRGRIRSSLESAYYNDENVSEKTVDVYYYAMRTPGAMHAVLARMRHPRSETEEWQVRIRELDVPTCIIWGADDTWIPVEDAKKFHSDISDSQLMIIPDCGHLPQEEEPGKFIMHVLDFMSGREGAIVVTKALEPAIDKSLHVLFASREITPDGVGLRFF